MEPIDYTALYEHNEDFKRYVDIYCVKHRISVAEALQHYLVQMALLDIQMVRFEEIFLPYIETENGQTIYERLEEKQFLLKAIN